LLSLRRTTFSFTARHEFPALPIHHAHSLAFAKNVSFLVDGGPWFPKHMHYTLVSRRQSNHPSPPTVTNHYDARLPPRPLTHMSHVLLTMTIHHSSFTIPFTRRVALSCLVVSAYFLHLAVFSEILWVSVVLDSPWFSVLVVPFLPVLADVRFIPYHPHHSPPLHICVFWKKSYETDLAVLAVERRRV